MCGVVMLIDIVEVKVLDGYKLFLKFENNVKGEVDISKIVPFEGVFEKLKDREYFEKVSIDKKVGTICWENDAHIAPSTLYDYIQSK